MPSDNANKTNIRIVKSDEGSSESVSATNERSAATETAVCQYCFGTGMEVVAGKGARPCRCRAQDFRGKLLEAARIPRRYQHCSIHTFYNVDHEMSKFVALGEAKKLIEEYPLQAERRGLLLVGPVGAGKTHLAVAILRELIERYGVRGLFYQFGMLLKEIQNSYNPISQTSELKLLEPVFEAEALVLDELGASVPTDWVRETMYQIINTRYNDNKLTIFTTNYLDEPGSEETEAQDQESGPRRTPERLTREMRPRYRTTYSLEERIGTRLRSRLYEMCHKVVIEGEDYRKRLDHRRIESGGV